MKKFNAFEIEWHYIEPDPNPNLRQKGYISIRRPATRAGLKAGRGQMITAMSVRPESLPAEVRPIAEEIIKSYKNL